jgi:hypothetical protein
MVQLTQRHQMMIALSLALLMLATRGHHEITPVNLPDASWAVFFLVGLYLPSRWFFAAFFLLASTMDYVAITWGDVSSFCVTGAYLFLIPAYGALWFAGRSYSPGNTLSFGDLLPLTFYALVGTLTCELISSGGFYFFSGRFVDTSLVEFADRLLKYLPPNLFNQVLYLGLAALVHGLFALLRGRGDRSGLGIG